MSKRVDEMETLIALRDVTRAAGKLTELPNELVAQLNEFDRRITAARDELNSIHKTLTSMPGSRE